MRIVYVGAFRTTSVGEPEVAKTLEELGHEVVRLEERNTSISEVRHKCQSADMLFFAKFRVGYPREREDFLKELRIPKVMWGFDLYFGL